MRLVRGITGVVAAAAALALAGPSQAAPEWHVVPTPAPGGAPADYPYSFSGTALTVVGTTPYLGVTELHTQGRQGDETGDVSVWRLNASGDGWEQIGGLLNHDPGTRAFIPPDGITSVGGTPWVTWGEYGGDNGRLKVRVARLVSGQFQAVAGGEPVNDPGLDASAGQLATLDGRVYVSFQEVKEGQDAGVSYERPAPQVARVATDGGSFERVSTGLPDANGWSSSWLVAAGGRLHFLHQHAFDEWTLFGMEDSGTWSEELTASGRVADAESHDGALHIGFAPPDSMSRDGVWRVAPQGGFPQVGDTPFDDARIESIASAGGTLYAVGRTEGAAPSFHGELRFAAYRDGAWEQLPVPTGPDERVDYFSELEPAADGSVWLQYTKIDQDGATTERVARYGEPPAPPEPASGPSAPPGPSDSDGGFTDPHGNPAPDAPGVRRGACANARDGTARDDRIVGSALGERLHGYAGNDELFGERGSDCVWGGRGVDTVSGGGGSDALSGGPGGDRLVPGAGRDDVAAGRGNDVIVAVGGGVDRVNCGPGYDRVRLSRNDLIKGCERVIVVRR